MGRYRKFERLDGKGITEEWDDDNGHVLAYLDRYHNSPMVSVTVFKPENGKSVHYAAREFGKGQAIVERHIATQAYTPDTEDE